MVSKSRTADAVWRGTGTEGQGSLTTASGTLSDVPYSAGMRFGDEAGTNPEELIAAAHAGCYTMALAVALAGAGHAPDELRATANVTITREDGGWRITASALDLVGRVPGISRDEFLEFAEQAKAGCPVSKVLDAEITLNAELA